MTGRICITDGLVSYYIPVEFSISFRLGQGFTVQVNNSDNITEKRVWNDIYSDVYRNTKRRSFM